MGDAAFEHYLGLIQAKIGTLNECIPLLERRTRTLTRRVNAGGDDAQKSARELAETQDQLAKIVTKIETFKTFYVGVKTRWINPEDRVIGYVVWAPPIGHGVPPNSYTRDLCVIKLDKKKFRNFCGNVLSLGPCWSVSLKVSHLTICIPGPEISFSDFNLLMHDRFDVPREFEYPEEGLLQLRGMLSAEDIKNSNSKNREGEHIRRVIKRGITTNTTVGTLSGFKSHDRKYLDAGILDSVEVAIFPHDNDSIAFTRRGDSGAVVVDALGRFVALITSGIYSGTESSDITFATPMEWVWDLIKDRFPRANLYFDDLVGFLADVA
jgi:hypothetical protein